MDKRTIIAFVLIGLILFFYGDYVKWVSPPPPPQPADTTAVAADAHSPLIEGPGSLGSPVEELDSSPATVADSIPQLPERVAVVETDRYILRISSVGAQIKSLKLKPYGRYLTEGVEMIPDDPGARPGYRFWTRDGAVETASLKFQLEDDEGAGDVGFRVKSDGRDTIRFFAPLGGGTGVRIRYIFNGSNFNFLTSMEGVGLANVVVRDYAEAGPSPKPTRLRIRNSRAPTPISPGISSKSRNSIIRRRRRRPRQRGELSGAQSGLSILW